MKKFPDRLPCFHRYDLPATLLAFCLLCCSAAFAQTVPTADGHMIGRPERIGQTNDATAVHRLPAKIGSRETASLQQTGSPKVPVVLVQFADRPFHAAGDDTEKIHTNYGLFFNGKDDNEVKAVTGSRGSIRNYFREQSLGQFEPEFVIIGPVTLDKGYAEYGSNKGNVKDVGINTFIRESMKKCVQETNVDWTIFDNDKNNTIDMIFFIHAGWGENVVQDIDPDAIWAKESITSMTVTPEGSNQSVTFSCYAVCAEARAKSNTQLKEDVQDDRFTNGYNPDNLRMDGIGVCIHELSHAMGLPDFYDTNYKAFGMDTWSVMDYGEYGNAGYNPCGYTAYERDFMGWQPLEELTDSCILTIPCFADGGHGYIIRNAANPDEYYVLENRQPKGWDDYVCKMSRGLMVTHVDFLADKWKGNCVNTDAKHQRMTIIAANENYNGTNVITTMQEWKENLAGNLFPYTQPTQSLTDETSPAATVYEGGFMRKPLYDITQNDDSTVTVYYLKPHDEYQEADGIHTIDTKEFMDVYSLERTHVARCLRTELRNLALPRGIYLVDYGKGHIRKLLLK